MSTDQPQGKDVVRRLRTDREYYSEKFLKILTKSSGVQPLVLNNEQKLLFQKIQGQEAAGLPIRGVVLKSRRVGFSTGIAAIVWHKTTTQPYQLSMTVAHDLEASGTIFAMHKMFYQHLPQPMRPLTREFNQERIEFENPYFGEPGVKPGLGSSLRIETAQKKTIGRSQLIHNLHVSELAFWPYPKDTLLSVQQCVPRAPRTMIIKESTANGIGGEFYQDYRSAKAGETSYFALFCPWYIHEEYTMPLSIRPEAFRESLTDEEKVLRKQHGLTLEQLNWRRETIKEECRGDVDHFRQEYPSNDIEAFIVSGRVVFNANTLLKWADLCVEPAAVGNLRRVGSFVNMRSNPHGYVKMWKPPQAGHSYVLGADVAEGIEVSTKKYDYSAGDVIDRDTLEQVATIHGHMTPDIFGKELCLLGQAYGKAFMGIEANNHGIATLNKVRDEGYPHLYYRKDIEAPGRNTQTQRKLGWLTTQKTKPSIIDDLAQHVEEETTIINENETIQEMITYVRQPDGKMGAQNECFDDRVMAKAIALRMHKECGLESVYPSLARVRRRASA